MSLDNTLRVFRHVQDRRELAHTWRMIGPIALLATAVSASTAAEPFLPNNDAEVLETLPQLLFSSRDELTTLRRQLAEDPTNVELVGQVASQYLHLGKSQGDPRYYGYAQAAIQEWWEDATAPPEILRLRAKLKERNHRYAEAVADLELLLEQQPQDAQAWIEIANIYRLQGNYAKARQCCDKLEAFAGATPMIMSRVPIQAVTGEAKEAYASLSDVMPTVRENFPSAVQWIVTMQAEIARALGRDEQAERHYREGLAHDPEDYYLLRSYADFLLDHRREDEVVPLVRPHLSDTGILLLAAIAADRSGQDALAADWKAQLKSRFEETRLRGDQPHGKFEARFELELMDNPQRSLTIAQTNWEQQKDPSDSRIVLEAAIAAKDFAAAQPVLKFLTQSGTQDVVIERLAQQLELN